jgi:DNA-binding CsgD family transcriptional regulator
VSNAMESVCLPEKDYLAILDVITQFNQCQTRSDIKQAFLSHLFPLFEAQGGLYAWTDPEISSPQLIDTLNIPESTVEPYQKFIRNDFMATEIMRTSRPVLACDVDLPRKGLSKQTDDFFKDNSQYRRKDHPYFDRMKTYLLTLDIPEPTLGIAIHRLTPKDRPWTFRDVRVLELLRPHLFQSIKTIALREELSKYKSLANKLAEVDNPVVLVTMDFRIVFRNRTFDQLFQLDQSKRLKEDLSYLLRREITKYDPPIDLVDSKIEIPFVNLPQGIFQLSFSRIDGNVSMEEGLWLLRMKPAVEPYSKMNIMMQEVGLTGREIEICILIRDGFDNQEIASRLFISLHTVKNHVRHIYQKMGVHTRAQLVALLNKQAEELE